MILAHPRRAQRDAATPGRIEPRAHVKRVVARSGTSFLWGMQALPRARRQAMYAIYAFCREVDDIADEPGALDDKLRALAAWREEIARLYAGRPARPTARALLEPVRRFGLPQEEFLAVIDGMESDARPTVRMPTMDDLLSYCRKVAGAVGMLSIHAFGASHQPGPRFAVALGNAFQLTNILRDLAEDARLERLYVPLATLAAHGVAPRAPNAVLADPGFAGACAELAALARGYYAEAERLRARLGWRPTRPPVLMMAVYRETLDRLEQRGWSRLDVPVRVTRGRKIWLALRHGLL